MTNFSPAMVYRNHTFSAVEAAEMILIVNYDSDEREKSIETGADFDEGIDTEEEQSFDAGKLQPSISRG